MNLMALIQSDATASAHYAARRDDECAARCMVIAPATHQPTGLITERGLYQALGPVMAETILQKMAGYAAANQSFSAVVARSLRWMEPHNDGVDFGDPTVLGLIDALTADGLLSSQENAAIKSLSLRPPTITAAQIEKLRIQNGVL